MLDLVQAARDGGARERDALIEAAWPFAYRIAYAMLRHRHAAEDAAQEACIIVYRSIATLRSADAFRVWFYRIVVREAASIRRRMERVDEDVRGEEDTPDTSTSIDVWRALESLPRSLREIVVLRFFEDLSSREIAAILRIPDGTVRFRLMMAKRRLRPLLEDLSPLHESPNEVRSHAI